VATVALVALTLLATPGTASAHGSEFHVVVEVVGLDADNPGKLALGIVLTFVDGDPVTGATVVVTAESATGRIVATASPTVEGVYIADFDLTEPGTWEITVDVDGDDSTGSVTFIEEVGAVWIDTPFVRVDTARPERQGLLVGDQSAVFASEAEPAAVTGAQGLVIEALVRDAIRPLAVEYGVLSPGSEVVELSASVDGGQGLGPITLVSVGGSRFIGRVEFPGAGLWSVSIAADGNVAATFAENLPWPHYSTEAGFPKIKVNTADASLEGTLTTVEVSLIFGFTPAEVPTSTATESETAAPATPPAPAAQTEVVVNLPDNASELRRQIGLRWLHLGSILLWVLGVGAVYRGWRGSAWKAVAVSGSIVTVATGMALTLWGAPTAYPGIFRWSELGDRLYGSAYQGAFQVKMLFVIMGLVATGLLVAKSTKRRFYVILGSMGGAVAALAVMSQFHLWAHL